MLSGKFDSIGLEEVAQVWYCTFSGNIALLSGFERFLSSDERLRAERFRFTKDRDRFVMARAILRLLLGRYLEADPHEIRLAYTAYGKPYLPDNTLKFNVSHSGDMAVFAFALHAEVGIDVEKVKDDLDVMELARNFFSDTEINAMERAPQSQRTRSFYRCWTRKEAFIKAEGSGLSFPLDQFAVSLDDDLRATLIATKWNQKEAGHWSLYSFRPVEGYLGALAIRRKLRGMECSPLEFLKNA